MDDDYEIQLRLARSAQEPLLLVCQPQWVEADNGSTSIGFAILRSPDTARLEAYIAMLDTEATDSNDSDLLPKEEPCQFV